MEKRGDKNLFYSFYVGVYLHYHSLSIIPNFGEAASISLRFWIPDFVEPACEPEQLSAFLQINKTTLSPPW